MLYGGQRPPDPTGGDHGYGPPPGGPGAGDEDAEGEREDYA